MNKIVKKVCCGAVLIALLGILIFPKQILLQCISWKACSYCKHAFAAKLQFQRSAWEKGEMVFEGGHLLKGDELDVSFEKATLVPFLDWKNRFFGGKLHFEGLKIIHHKKELGPVPSPPPPSFKFLTLKLDTSVQNGELFLYDYLARNHFFQHVKFELSHQVEGKQTKGSISFACADETPPFIAHFHGLDDKQLNLTVNLQQHSCSILSHLISYFFHSYVPKSALQWDILGGTIDGNLHLSLMQGVPQKINGKFDLREFQTSHSQLNIQTQFERLKCDLAFDFAHSRAMQCQFDLKDGALQSQRKLCYLDNVDAKICIQEGKIIRSFAKGNWMGLAAEIYLDWNNPNLCMHTLLTGSCDCLTAHLPQKLQSGFSEGFSEDLFTLDASLKKTTSGFDLAGKLEIEDVKNHLYQIVFGGKCEPHSEHFLDLLSADFCKGWFHAKALPLDKFISPFLLQDVKMQATGIADFTGTLNDKQLVVHYEGNDFCLESPYFKLELDRVCQQDTKVPMHHFDLKTKNHFGVLPMKKGKYYQKNYHFLLEEALGDVRFENNKIYLKDISATSEGLLFSGNVDFEVRSCEDVEMIIHIEKIRGSIKNAQSFLSHFKPSFFWEIPCDGEVISESKTALFHYHFAPYAHLLSGYVKGEVLPTNSNHWKNLKSTIHFDCKTQFLECHATQDGIPFVDLHAKTIYSEEGKTILVTGTGPAQYQDICVEMTQKKGEERSTLSFDCGPWSGNGVWDVLDRGIALEWINCWDKEERGFSFSGFYDQSKQVLKGNFQSLKWDLSRLPWKFNGNVTGCGPLVWDIKRGLCSVEGLGLEIPSGEIFSLGRCHYDMGIHKLHFEGLDFLLTPEKVQWAAHVASGLFPLHIDPTLFEYVKNLKSNEPLKGHLSLEVFPNNVWVCLQLAEGEYCIAGHKMNLDQFCLIYDPTTLNIKCHSFYYDQPLSLHLITDSSMMEQGVLLISSSDRTDDEAVRVCWERRDQLGWCIRSVSGSLGGLALNLSDLGRRAFSNSIALEGLVEFRPDQMTLLLSQAWRRKIEQYALKGKYQLKGEFSIPKNDLPNFTFEGELTGDTCQVNGIEWSKCSSYLKYTPSQCQLTACSIKDPAGRLSIGEINLNHSEKNWDFALDKLHISDMYLARLKGPWKHKGTFDKSFFRSLYVRSFTLDHCEGDLANKNSFLGNGRLEFSNIPKRTFLSNLLFLPSEITARIGLDLSALVPARGTITYNVQNGKVNFQEFKEMYSDGKYSRFYLADGSPSYIDFQGNLNLKLKMKQYNLLMKLAEFFTISVKGTLMHPSYTLNNHVDAD